MWIVLFAPRDLFVYFIHLKWVAVSRLPIVLFLSWPLWCPLDHFTRLHNKLFLVVFSVASSSKDLHFQLYGILRSLPIDKRRWAVVGGRITWQVAKLSKKLSQIKNTMKYYAMIINPQACWWGRVKGALLSFVLARHPVHLLNESCSGGNVLVCCGREENRVVQVLNSTTIFHP